MVILSLQELRIWPILEVFQVVNRFEMCHTFRVDKAQLCPFRPISYLSSCLLRPIWFGLMTPLNQDLLALQPKYSLTP